MFTRGLAPTVALALVLGGMFAATVAAHSAGDGVTWYVNGKRAPMVIEATVGQVIGDRLNSVFTITARRKGPANEPLNGVWCVYRGSRGGGLKGGPPPFNDCSRIPGVDTCNMRPTVSDEPAGESIGCLLPGSPTRAGTYHFRLWTAWTDFQRDPSGHTMGYDVHRFTVIVNEASTSG